MASSIPSSSANNNPAPAAEIYQPTVRVMRLYKPGFHLVSTLPFVPCADQVTAARTSVADFALSPYMLLPDSFGDIFSGEKFSAYIAVVNGYQNVPFYQVSLAIRLQTTSTVIDLTDTRGTTHPPLARTLGSNEAADMIVQHNLTELGIHTLRVSVQYMLSPTSETKTLRKFYRFNVLQPLTVTSYFVEVDNKPLIQCQVSNATKTPIYIEEMNFIPLNQYSTIVDLNKPKRPLTLSAEEDDFKDYFADSVRLLMPDESFAFSFLFSRYQTSGVVTKSVGHPEIKWCTTMGEFSIFRGDDTLQKGVSVLSPPVSSNFSAGNVKIQCLSCPSQVSVGESFEISLRISNVSPRPIPARLQCLNTTSSSDGYYTSAPTIGGSTGGSGSTSLAGSTNNSPKGSSAALASGGSASAAVTSAPNPTLGLCVTGLTYVSIGKIESGEFVDTTITVFALCAGLHDLLGVYVVDAITKQRYSNDNLCKVFVVDNDDEQLSEEEAKKEVLAQQQREAQQRQEKAERERVEVQARERLQSEDRRYRDEEKRRELAKLEQIKREEQLRVQLELEEAAQREEVALHQQQQQQLQEQAVPLQRAVSLEERGDLTGDVDEVVEDVLEVEELGGSRASGASGANEGLNTSEGVHEGSLQEESLLEEISSLLDEQHHYQETQMNDQEGGSNPHQQFRGIAEVDEEVDETASVPDSHVDPSPLPHQFDVDSSRDVTPLPGDDLV